MEARNRDMGKAKKKKMAVIELRLIWYTAYVSARKMFYVNYSDLFFPAMSLIVNSYQLLTEYRVDFLIKSYI